MMKKLILFTLLLLASKITIQAQGEANIWYFGNNAGLDFNSGSPVVIYDSNMQQFEGSASISDVAGNLLFYTDADTVWNKNHVHMPNGIGLDGHHSSNQATLIVQQPSSTDIYYVFTMNTGASTVSYSIVDMSLDGGLGDVTTKNTLLISSGATEKLTAALHTNCEDIWVLTHQRPNNYHAYLISSTGISATPVITSIGINAGSNWGQMKASPDGSRIGVCTKGTSSLIPFSFELLDFDNITGVLSNLLTISDINPHAFDFSPNGTVLYITTNLAALYQFDISSGNIPSIQASKTYLGSSIQLQRGPDQKIYSSNGGIQMGIIHEPNNLGVACNYQMNALDLSPGSTDWGLPNIPSYYLKPPCGISLSFDGLNTEYCDNMGDITLGASHSGGRFFVNGTETSTFSPTTLGVGTHTVFYSYKDPINCCTASISQEVAVEACCETPTPTLNFSNLETQYCENAPEVTLEASPSGGTFEVNGNMSNRFLASNLGLGTHTIKYIYTDAGGCILELDQNVEIIDCPDPTPTTQDFFIPDLFSPNADGSNDTFTIAGEGIATLTLKIFDRHGNLLYETSDSNEAINQGWNGKHNGQEQPDGVYIWQIEGDFADGSKLDYQGKQEGTFYLMR